MRTRNLSVVALLATGLLAAVGVTPAAAAGGLLPHPGPEGLVWVQEWVGDGGVASAGAWEGLPTVLTVACEGGGTVDVTMQSQGDQVAAFTVDCPAGTAGVGSVTMDAGVVRTGSFTIGVDASDDTVRWALTVTQPE
ncbi:hypothetical protein [Streptomyces sp. NBC_00887]|uniref:hypothetical protein n=1 Tax=Streptomyces sp. NBC_00887 TaxID=2975859 RepID=UPI002F914AF4|nr:hypothetical protein OG844_46280 [Streptomyces sp. NBC_00887]